MTRTMTWIAADGTELPLDGSAGVILQHRPIGLEAPNPSNTIDDFAAFDGGVLIHRRRPVRQLALGLYMEHPTRVDTVVADVARALAEPGQLRWVDDVHTRTLRKVVYDGGLDGSGDGNLLQRSAVVSLLALDPWWYGPAASTALSTAAPTSFDEAIPFNSVFPFDGGNSTAVPIDGDAEAYPTFTVTGPCTTLVVTSGGLSWSIAGALAAGHTLVVDHRPTSRGPRLDDQPVDWSLLTEASRLFPLATGTTAVIVGATGTTGATGISMAWEPRHLTP